MCLREEPESLYIYNFASQAAKEVASIIYPMPYKTTNGQYQPVILENLPSFSDGSARFTPTGVNPGDPVVIVAQKNIAVRFQAGGFFLKD